jgi:hypothetical protein
MKKILIIGALLGSSIFAPLQAQTAPVKVKCIATTLKGETCSRAAQKDDTKCFQHSDTAARCSAPTSAGSTCKRVVKAAGIKCFNHKK